MSESFRYWVLPASGIPPLGTYQKLLEFRELPDGWHYGEGSAISDEVIGIARNLLSFSIGIGFTETDAFPGLAGQARITLYRGDHYLELTVDPGRTITYLREVADEEVESEEGLTHEETTRRLFKAAGEIWPTSDLFTPNITIAEEEGFKAARSVAHLETEVYRLSTEDAWTSRAGPFVSTHDISIRKPSQATRQFSGSSGAKYFLTTAA